MTDPSAPPGGLCKVSCTCGCADVSKDTRPVRRHPTCHWPPQPSPRTSRSHAWRQGFRFQPNHDAHRKRRILPVISRRGNPNVKDMGEFRYVVEQAFAVLHRLNRLAV